MGLRRNADFRPVHSNCRSLYLHQKVCFSWFYNILLWLNCIFQFISGEPVVVRLGVHSIAGQYPDNFNGTDHSLDFLVEENIVHPEYRTSSTYNDIALVRLRRSVRLNQYMRPACLATETNEDTLAKATATGWGLTEFKGDSSDKLLKVNLELFNQTECVNAFKRNINRRLSSGIMETTQICYGSHTEEKDTCSVSSFITNTFALNLLCISKCVVF